MIEESTEDKIQPENENNIMMNQPENEMKAMMSQEEIDLDGMESDEDESRPPSPSLYHRSGSDFPSLVRNQTTHSPDALSFVKDFLGHEIEAQKQVEGGLNRAKRVSNFLRKFADTECAHAREIKKQVENELTKVNKSRDGCQQFMDSWVTLQKIVGDFSEMFNDMGTKVLADVARPISLFHKEAETKRKILYQQSVQLKKSLEKIKEKALSERKQCEIVLQQLDASMIDLEREDGVKAEEEKLSHMHQKPTRKTGVVQNVFNKLGKTKEEKLEEASESARKACDSYHKSVMTYNQAQEQYMTRDLPNILTELQNLEESRLILMKEKMAQFGVFLEELTPTIQKMTANMQTKTDVMDSQTDLGNYIQSTLSSYKGVKIVPLSYDMKLTAEQVSEETALFQQKRATTQFSSRQWELSLEELMLKQKDKYPDETVPKVITFLVDNIKRDLNQQGLFRVPASGTQLIELRKQLFEMNFDTYCLDTIIPATLLKEILRYDPLISSELYKECIALCKQNMVSNQTCINIYNKMTPLKQAVTKIVASLIISVSEQAKTNKMTLENLAMVFRPAFLKKAGSGDPQEILENCSVEIQFLYQYVLSVSQIEQEK